MRTITEILKRVQDNNTVFPSFFNLSVILSETKNPVAITSPNLLTGSFTYIQDDAQR